MRNTQFNVCLLILFPLLIGANEINAQGENLDSLNQVWKNSPLNEARVETGHDILRYLIRNKPDSAISFSEILWGESREVGNDSLEAITLHLRGSALVVVQKLDSAYANELRARDLFERFDNLEGLSAAELGLGNISYYRGDYFGAAEHYKEALEYEMELGPGNDASYCYNNIGLSYMAAGRNDSAIHYLWKSIRLEESDRDTATLAQSYNNVALNYNAMNSYEEAIRYFRTALKMKRQVGDSVSLYSTLQNMHLPYWREGKPDSALHFLEEALEIARRIGYRRGQKTSISSIGRVLADKGEYERSVDYLKRGLEMELQDSVANDIGSTYINLADSYSMWGKNDSAYKYLEKGMAFIDRGAADLKQGALSTASEVYARAGEFEWAYYYAKRFKEYSDSLLDKEKVSAIEEMRVIYETEKKEAQIEALARKKELAELREQQRTNQLWAAGIGGFLLLVLIGVGAALYRVRERQRRQEQLMRVREEGLNAVIEATEQERKRIAKDLHDGLGQQLSGIKLAFSRLREDFTKWLPHRQKEWDKIYGVIDRSCNDVREISHRMMPHALSEIGLIPALRDMLEKSANLAGIEHEFETYGLKDGDRFAERIEVGLYRVAQELVNNILKHSEATRVSMQLIRNKERLVMVVEDNGKGFERKSKGSGLGLKSIESRVRTLGGEVEFSPGPQAGTVVTARVPVNT